MTNNRRRKRCRPLGVLEFTSALNGDDNYQILSKLRHFVNVVSHERRLALFSSSSSSSTDAEGKITNDHRGSRVDDREPCEDYYCDAFDYNSSNDEDDNEDDDDDTIQPTSSSKRHKSSSLLSDVGQKQRQQKQLPSWANDTNNYGNPFIGTAIATPHNESYGTVTIGRWPTGFILEYMQHSPLGIELLNNDYVTKLYDNSNNSSNSSLLHLSEGKSNGNATSRKGGKRRSAVGEGVVDTKAIRYYHWSAIYEWLLSYIPAGGTLHRDSKLDDDWPLLTNNNHTYDDVTARHHQLLVNSDCDNESQQQQQQQQPQKGKCHIPPTVLTVLIKCHLPEWITAIREYVVISSSSNNDGRSKQQQQQKTQQRQQSKASSSSLSIAPKGTMEEVVEKRQQIRNSQREELLLLSCIRNLIALCHLSDGSAREVLRKLTIGTITTTTTSSADDDVGRSKKENASAKLGGKGKGTIHRPTNNADGTLWMEHIFRSQSSSSSSSALITSTSSYRARIECLKLVCALLETKDDVILSRLIEIPPSSSSSSSSSSSLSATVKQRGYSKKSTSVVNTKGSNERKNYGLAYIALRYGMHELFELGKNDDHAIIHQRQKILFARYMTRLLQDVRSIILTPLADCRVSSGTNDGRKRGNTALSMNVKADLFTTEIINNLTKLSSLAPSFDATNESIQSIIYATDRYDNLNFIEFASLEARRILFILLLDTRRSPFLVTIHRSTKNKVARQQLTSTSIATNDNDRSALLLSQLASALHAILATNYQQYSPSSKVLLTMCLQGTPELVPHYFHKLQLSDPKISYGSLSAIVFVEDVVRMSPLPSLDSAGLLLSVDDLPSAIIPPCITRSLLGKIIQNSSALLVSSGLKLIITLLRRVHEFVSTTTSIDRFGLKKSSLLQAIICHLPDVALLLSIPSRFDPFEYHQPLSLSSSSNKSNSFVVLLLCKALECYAQLDTTLLIGVKFDWSKLVPNTNNNDDQQQPIQQGRIFSHAEPLLQLRILHTLLLLTRINNMPSFSSKMLPNVLSVLISTIIPEVYSEARKLALILLERELFSVMISTNSKSSLIGEDGQCSNYESALWIDGMSSNIIDKFIKLIDESKQVRVEQKIAISQALSEYSFVKTTIHARLGISSFLVWIISRLLKDESFAVSNKQLSLLALQVATKMLLYVADPSLFAAVIYHCSAHGGVHEDKRIDDLCKFAKHILNKNHETNLLMESLTSELFAPSNVQLVNADKQEVAQIANVSNIRQCLFKMKFSDEHNEDLYAILRKMLISIIETGDDVAGVISRLGLLYDTNDCKTAELETIVLMLLSSPTIGKYTTEITDFLTCDAKLKQRSIAMGVASALLRCSLIRASHESTFLVDVWRYCVAAFKSSDPSISSLKQFLMLILMHTIHSGEESTPFIYPPDVMFDLWAAIAGNSATDMSVKICHRLENCLSALFMSKKCGHGAWIVYQRVISITPTSFVQLWLNTREGTESNYDDTTSLLDVVLEYDCSQFSCLAFLNDELLGTYHSGAVDAVAATFVLQANKQGSIDNFMNIDSCWVDIVGKKFIALLVSKDHDQANVSFEEIIGVLDALRMKCLDMQNALLCIFDRFKTLPLKDEVQLMMLIKKRSNDFGPNSSLILTKALLRCCQSLPKHIKRILRTNPAQRADLQSLESLVCVLAHFIRNDADRLDKTVVNQSYIDNCAVACLKYGLTEPIDASLCSILGGCIKIVRLLTVETDPWLSQDDVRKSRRLLGSLTPSQIHVMAVSHSSFHATLSYGNRRTVADRSLICEGGTFCDGVSQQLELIRLLLCSVGGDVKIDTDTLTSILSLYNASTGVVDGLLRQLMYLYEIHGCYQDEITLNYLQWGPASSDYTNNDSEKESWEWFINALDIDRVRCTLCQFPVADTFEPTVIDDKFSQQHEERCSSDEIVEEIDYDMSSVAPINSSRGTNSARESGCDTWRGVGDDIRYSPGFILPLILATMEAYRPTEKECNTALLIDQDDDVVIDRDSDYDADCYAFGIICKRISDRGGIALAIASLSSRCPSIRQLAIAICGLFLTALQMQESHGIKIWRERPQQELILSSIQRGLAVRRSIQIQKCNNMVDGIELGEMTTTETTINIPMLPAVSAIFLAKALLIVSRPGDDMYGPINRYFLRLVDYHGAFQDCFGLPAFLSLYCSSSAELSRCRIERGWALLCLKDGVVDEYCYRIISQHHVPELLMSSVDSMMDDPDSHSELYLTLDVIETLIQSGGVHASTHLIKRQGLLSWLHGIISWRRISSVFPYVALKCKFLNLITAAVDSYRSIKHPSNDEEFYEKVSLANNVVRICLDNDDQIPTTTTYDDESVPDTLSTLIGSTCNALWAINLAGRQSLDVPSTLYSGGAISQSDMSSLLVKFVQHEDMFEKVLSTLCDLPLASNDTDISAAKLFSSLALAFILKQKLNLEPETIVLSLKRVHEIMELNPILQEDKMLLAQIVKCRQLSVLFGCIDVWNLFLPYLMK